VDQAEDQEFRQIYTTEHRIPRVRFPMYFSLLFLAPMMMFLMGSHRHVRNRRRAERRSHLQGRSRGFALKDRLLIAINFNFGFSYLVYPDISKHFRG
jgi:hypothetical protein